MTICAFNFVDPPDLLIVATILQPDKNKKESDIV